MNFELLVPISLFICITYAIKAVVDARVRRQMLESNGSQDLLRSIMAGEDLRQKHGSLRWGITLLAVGIGFLVVDGMGWTEITPGVIAVLAIATGLGNLGYYALTRRFSPAA